MRAGKVHKFSLVSTNLASLVKVIIPLDQRILTRVVQEEEATVEVTERMAKMPSIFSRIMILSARTESTTLVKKWGIGEAKKRLATWRKRLSSPSSWSMCKATIWKSASTWWQWQSLPSSENGSSPYFRLSTGDVSSETAKTNSSVLFTTSSLPRRYSWWATTRSTSRRSKQTIRLAHSIPSLLSCFTTFASIVSWSTWKKTSIWLIIVWSTRSLTFC